jgi:hypothetical protein
VSPSISTNHIDTIAIFPLGCGKMNSKQHELQKKVEGMDLDQKLEFLKTECLRAGGGGDLEYEILTLRLLGKTKNEADIALIKKHLPIISAITAMQVLTVFLYPKWCRYRHSISPYNAEQLMMRKQLMNVQFEPPFKPFKPKIISKFYQATAIYGAIWLIRKHYQLYKKL